MFALVAGVLGVSAISGAAAGGADTATEHLHQETVVFYDYVPCHEELGAYRITAIINAVEHGTEKGDTAHFTFTETGRFFAEAVNADLVYDPETDENTPVPADPTVDPTKPTYEGRYTVWGGYNGNGNNEASTFTFSATGRGSDGSRFNASNVFHGSLSATGAENVFEHVNCH
jgi:hypothetical protein